MSYPILHIYGSQAASSPKQLYELNLETLLLKPLPSPKDAESPCPRIG
jgi:hypothetical protein